MTGYIVHLAANASHMPKSDPQAVHRFELRSSRRPLRRLRALLPELSWARPYRGTPRARLSSEA
jgi:hypothetical protein